MKTKLFQAATFVAVSVWAAIVAPLLILWSLNAVFALGIPYTLKTVLGAYLLKTFVRAYVQTKITTVSLG